jgi:hypothetical protein
MTDCRYNLLSGLHAWNLIAHDIDSDGCEVRRYQCAHCGKIKVMSPLVLQYSSDSSTSKGFLYD